LSYQPNTLTSVPVAWVRRGAGVHGGHEAAFQAERVVEHLGHRRHAVGGARRVRDHVVLLRLVVVLVDAHHHGEVGALARGGDQHLARAALEVEGRVVAGTEPPGGLDDNVRAELTPVDPGRVAAGQRRDAAARNDDRAIVGIDVGSEPAIGGIERQQVRQGPRIGDVVDGGDPQIVPFEGGAHE
jgi:hypothetical protein